MASSKMADSPSACGSPPKKLNTEDLLSIARVREKINNPLEAWDVLQEELKEKPQWVRDVVHKLMMTELQASCTRTAKSIRAFKDAGTRMAELETTPEMKDLRRLLQKIRDIDVRNLEKLGQESQDILHQMEQCITDGDYKSLRSFGAMLKVKTQRFRAQYEKILPLVETAAKRVKTLPQMVDNIAGGAIQQFDRNIAIAQGRKTSYDAFMTCLDDFEESLRPTLVEIVGYTAVSGVVLLGAALAMGGAAALTWTIGVYGLGAAAIMGLVGIVVPPMLAPALATAAASLAVCGLGALLSAAAGAAAALAAVPLAVCAGAVIILALFTLGFCGRRAVRVLLHWILDSEIDGNRKKKQACEEMLLALREGLSGLDKLAHPEFIPKLLEGLEEFESMIDGLDDSAEAVLEIQTNPHAGARALANLDDMKASLRDVQAKISDQHDGLFANLSAANVYLATISGELGSFHQMKEHIVGEAESMEVPSPDQATCNAMPKPSRP